MPVLHPIGTLPHETATATQLVSLRNHGLTLETLMECQALAAERGQDDLRRLIRRACELLTADEVDGEPAEELFTPANREAVAAALTAYFGDALGEKMNSRHASAAVGMALAERFVTRLEIGATLKDLQRERRDLAYFVDARYRRGLTVSAISRLCHRAPKYVGEQLAEAIDFFVERLFR